MSSASGSQAYVAVIKQTPATPSVIPATPVMQKVNFVSDDLNKTINTKVSDHIRDDRATADQTITGINIGGGYGFEFQYENSLLDELLASFLWVDGWSAGGSLTSIIKNGVFYQPYFIERGNTDISQYFKYVGMACNAMSFDFPDQSDVTGSFQFIGLSSQLDQVVETGATYTAVTENPIFSAVTDISAIEIAGVAQSSCIVKGLTLEVNNNATPKTGLGVQGACETKAHRLSITGTITMYFEDETMYDRLQAGTAFSLTWTLTDSDSNSYIFTLPRVKLNSGGAPVTGVDEDVMENATFTALYDSSSGCMIQIEKS